MTVTTNDRGHQNLFAKEPLMEIIEVNETHDKKAEPTMYTDENYTVNHNDKAEKLNGRLAMLGVIAALGAYALTGQLIPGVW